MKKNDIINSIVNAFINKYFKNTNIQSWWVDDEIDTVFYINDFWFGTEDMLYCVCNDVSVKKFFECYKKFEQNLDITSQLETKPLIEFLKNNK
jgi:hypothetical protein